MAGGYSSREYVFKNTTQEISGVVTDEPVTGSVRMSDQDSLRFVARLTVSNVTAVGTITAKIQHKWESSDWEDIGSEAQAGVTVDGTVEIKMDIEDATDRPQLPTAPQCRVVITTTNAGDAVDVESVVFSRRL